MRTLVLFPYILTFYSILVLELQERKLKKKIAKRVEKIRFRN